MILPFENNTRAVEKKLADRSLSANKRRNILAGIIIYAASFLLCFAAVLLCNAAASTEINNSVNNSKELFMTIFGIAIVLLCTAGLAVKNILYVSVLQRTHEFAQLRILGATYRQIVSVVNGERKKMTYKFVISGLLSGLLCNVVLPLDFYGMPSILCALFSGIFIWFVVFCSFRTPVKMAASVSPMEALKQVRDFNINGTKRSRSNKISPESLGNRYFGENHKKLIYTLSSLIISGVLMFTVLTVVSAVNIEKLARGPYKENSELLIGLNSTADENSTYNLMKNSPFDETLRQKISGIPGVVNIFALKMLDCNVVNTDVQKEIKFSIESILNETGLEKQIVEGKIPVYESSSDVIPVVINRASIYYEKAGLMFQLGDRISAYVEDGDSEQRVQLFVCGFIEDKNTGIVLYTNNEYLDKIAKMNCDLIWYICTEKTKSQSVVSEIQKLLQSDSRVYVSVLENDISSYQTIFYNAKVIITVITILICMFSFINLLNTCITNAIVRNHDYALLQAVGMTKKQIRKMQNSENMRYLAGSFIGSCMLGIPAGYLMCEKIAKLSGISYIEYNFPLWFAALYILFIAIINGIISIYQKHMLNQYSIIERIKTID